MNQKKELLGAYGWLQRAAPLNIPSFCFGRQCVLFQLQSMRQPTTPMHIPIGP